MGLNGTSNATGFAIWDAHGMTVMSSRYRWRSRTTFSRITGMYLLLCGIGVVLLIASLSHMIGLINAIIIFIIILAVPIFIIVDYGKKMIVDYGEKRLLNERNEWHGVEHKLINVLESGQELTIGHLRKASIIHSLCDHLNINLKEPTNQKLEEGFRVGLSYLELKKNLSPFFSSPQWLIRREMFSSGMKKHVVSWKKVRTVYY